jgi:hypothetical protein
MTTTYSNSEFFFKTYAKWFNGKPEAHQEVIRKLFFNRPIIISNIDRKIITTPWKVKK